jgi:hypothetical protein
MHADNPEVASRPCHKSQQQLQAQGCTLRVSELVSFMTMTASALTPNPATDAMAKEMGV